MRRRTWVLIAVIIAGGLLGGTLTFPLPPTMAGFTPTFTAEPPTATAVPPTLTPVPPTPTPVPPPPPPPPPPPETPTATPTVTRTPLPRLTPTATRTPSPTATPAPRIVVEKRVQPGEVNPGDRVQITVVICNQGAGAARDVMMEDTLPDYLVILGVTTTAGIPTVSGQTVTVRIGTLAPGVCVTVTIDAQVRADTPPGTDIVNVAVVRYRGGTAEGRFPTPTPTPIPPLPEAGRTVGWEGASVWFLLLGLLALAAGLYLRRSASGDRENPEGM